MTNTVTIPSNMLPEDGRFGSGPTKIRPEQIQALDAGARNLLGTSHRQTPIKQVVGSIREGLSEFFQIPDGYEVVLGNGGASAFWDIACASLITRKAAFGTYGSFSSKFAKSAQSAPFLEEPEIFAGEPGTYRLPELTEYVDTYCWAHNETSTGVAAPIKRIAGTKEQGALTLIDATSGAGALPVDISQTDAYYFSPQKAFGWRTMDCRTLPRCNRTRLRHRQKRGSSGRTPLDSSVPFPDFGHREFPQGSDAQHAGSGNADHAGKPGSLAQRQRWARLGFGPLRKVCVPAVPVGGEVRLRLPVRKRQERALQRRGHHRSQRWHQCIPSGGGIARKRHCGHQRIP